jgi:5'-3' exonuclease
MRSGKRVTGNKQQTIMLVDGMALLFRAYFASATSGYIRRTKAGVPTNAIYGFVRYFWDAIETFNPSHVICCWDLGGPTFRAQEYSAYKGNRSEAPDDLIPQFSLIKDVVKSFGIPNVSCQGYEADDCIGTLASQISQEMNVTVLTGDHDLLQLVNPTTSVIIMKKGQGNYKVYTPESLYEEKQLLPRQIIEMKALMGDASDNYPGVRGIGEKTAMKLVQEYGSIEGILENLDQLSSSVRTKIENDLEMLHLSRRLAEIHCTVPVEYSLEGCQLELDHDLVSSKFQELEMNSLCQLMGVAIS